MSIARESDRNTNLLPKQKLQVLMMAGVRSVNLLGWEEEKFTVDAR